MAESWHTVRFLGMDIEKHKPEFGETVKMSDYGPFNWHNLPREGVAAIEQIMVNALQEMTELTKQYNQQRPPGGGD